MCAMSRDSDGALLLASQKMIDGLLREAGVTPTPKKDPAPEPAPKVVKPNRPGRGQGWQVFGEKRDKAPNRRGAGKASGRRAA